MPDHFQPALPLDDVIAPAAANGVADISDTLGAQAIQCTGTIKAQLFLDREDRFGKTCRHEATIAARSTPADALRFEQDHGFAAPRQFERGSQPSKAAAYDADISGQTGIQRFMNGQFSRCLRIETRDMACRTIIQCG